MCIVPFLLLLRQDYKMVSLFCSHFLFSSENIRSLDFILRKERHALSSMFLDFSCWFCCRQKRHAKTRKRQTRCTCSIYSIHWKRSRQKSLSEFLMFCFVFQLFFFESTESSIQKRLALDWRTWQQFLDMSFSIKKTLDLSWECKRESHAAGTELV